MKWEKLGFLFCANGENEWMISHAMLPIAINLQDDIFRIYFSSRDKLNRSHGNYIDIDIKKPQTILNISAKPILVPGRIGYFDDSGSQPCSLLRYNNINYLYYVGWTLGQTIPFRTFLGLATNKDINKIFKKISKSPILSWDSVDNLSIGWNFVLYHENKFKMWYESNINWQKENGIFVHYFVIKYAESQDGITWKKRNKICIPINKNENVISRPSVIIENNIYKMWYSYKSFNKYKIGYAESNDGIDWLRKDLDAGLEVSDEGWDSEQVEYPFIFDHKQERYMLYNGNNYGKSGFGLAKLIK